MSGIDLVVETNLPEFHHWIRQATTKQLAFAEALAVTRLVNLAKVDVINDLPTHFTVRSRWLAQGIRIKPASKSDFPSIQGAVGTRDEFMVLQEIGGIRKPRSRAGAAGAMPPVIKIGKRKKRIRNMPTMPGPNLSIPSVMPGAVRASQSALIPLSARPKSVLRKPQVFLQKLVSGPSAGKWAILRRAQPGSRYPLQVLYIFRPESKIAPRFKFRPTVAHLVARSYGPVFLAALQEALKPKIKKRSSA